jgi:ubiquinone/menaquinone biosynthesis C-methylase UbiE
MGHSEHDRVIARAFTEQAAGFDASAVANAQTLLDAIVGIAEPQAGERWLEAACGPGVIARAFAPHVASVHGVDLTPAMIDTARRRAAEAGAPNLTFDVADATATGLPAASFDGAVTRFSIHHLPVPARLFEELARIVRPGGRLVIADHLADEDADARAWSQEIERLRDPSHWASVTAEQMRVFGERAGLELSDERRLAFELDFDDWLTRGSRNRVAHGLVDRALADAPAAARAFTVRERAEGRRLTLELWLGLWTRP